VRTFLVINAVNSVSSQCRACEQAHAVARVLWPSRAHAYNRRNLGSFALELRPSRSSFQRVGTREV